MTRSSIKIEIDFTVPGAFFDPAIIHVDFAMYCTSTKANLLGPRIPRTSRGHVHAALTFLKLQFSITSLRRA
ncbi:hypothetical protein RSAG8_07025, partial [Rhizoctonia solani AG-8 WAC10335]